MSGDVGRGAALLLAVLLGVFAPLCLLAGRTEQNMQYALQEAADDLTAKVEAHGAITLSDYENMLAAVAGTGVVCSVEMFIGKRISREAESISTIRSVAGHVHTRDCYAGHNHNAEGCAFHSHTSDCYCGGRMTKCYKTDYSSRICGNCGGSGQTGGTETCSSCAGSGGSYQDLKCSCSGGMVYYPATCGSCGGSGVNSKGKTCKTCGGTGKVDAKKTHDYCGGKGYINRWVTCSTCRGSGTVSMVKTCSSCGGSGSRSSSVSYYCCSVCGKGSTTSYGALCGTMICGYDREGWLCGKDKEDNTPLCGRIAVDAAYASEQILPAGSTLADIDRSITFTFLDGNKRICEAELDGNGLSDPPEAGEFTLTLSYTGYYLNARTYETHSFPVRITVETEKEPTLLGIRAESAKAEYMQGEAGEIIVYGIFEDCEEPIDPDDCWDTFDSSIAGDQLVYVGYRGFMTTLTMVVKGENEQVTAIPPEDDEVHMAPPAMGDGNVPDTGAEDSGADHVNGEEPESGSGEDSGNSAERKEEIVRAAYEEMIGSEEILELLTNSGRIDLEEGDSFSITITVEKENSKALFNLFGRTEKKKYTSGVLIK